MKSVSTATNKLVDLRNIICEHDAQIVAITETWLNPDIGDHELLPPRFCVHRKDRHVTVPGKRGGGLLLGIDSSIPSRRRPELEPQCEIIVCEINVHNVPKLVVILCYRPPLDDKNVFISHLQETLFKVHKEYAVVFLLGDFNFPDINWTANTSLLKPESDFLQLMTMYFLSQINTVPSNKQKHMLDLLFINTEGISRNVSDAYANYDTDHTVLYFDMCLNIPRKRGPKREVFNYKKTNFDMLSILLHASDLLNVLVSCADVNEMWFKWKSIVLNQLNACAPKVTIRDTQDPPWIDGETRHMINKKKTAWHKAKRCDSTQSWARFRSISNQTKSLIRDKHASFIASLDTSCKTNLKRFWSFFHFKTKSRSLPDIVCDAQAECSTPCEKATMFNRYFGSVFNHAVTTENPRTENVDLNSVSDPFFSVDLVEDCLSKIDVKRAFAPNTIPPVILKNCRFLLAPSLCVLFNTCIQCECIPNEWKKAYVVPIHKKGDRKEVSNYRPISLLCSVSKALERCIFNQLYPEIENLIHPLQHGFIKGRSCTSQLLDVYHRIGSILDKGGQIDMVFLDFSKAFDCICHQLLLYKLQHLFGIGGNLLGFIQSYLHERSQCVVVDGKNSNWISVPSGVPQGSILGPLFFLLFINDMPNVSESTTALFADDAKCFKSINSIDNCICLQNDINRFHDWSVAWNMTFNASKCKVLTISRKHQPIMYDYKMNNQSLEHVGTFRDLGVVIDETLSFTTHIDNVISKCNKLCGAIKRAVGFAAPQRVKLTLFNSLVRSHLDYASQVWSPSDKNKILQIESVQRSMTRYIVNNELSYSDRCAVLEILPLSYRREIFDLFFIYKYFNGVIKVDYSLFVQLYESNSRSHPGPTVRPLFSHPNTECFTSSYFNRICQLWNILPFNIRSCKSFNNFKVKLFTHYKSKLNVYSPHETCTLTSICRCRGYYHTCT